MSSFELNRKGVGEFLRGPEIKAEMERRALKVEARAIALAPVGRNDATVRSSGKNVVRYKDAFKVSTGIRRAGTYDPDLDFTFRTSRAYARVENTKVYAVFVEYGTWRGVEDEHGQPVLDDNGKPVREKVNAHRVLGRAIDAAGD
jgi:hypothetical protein